MQRFIDAIGLFMEAVGRYPVGDGLGVYRDLEYPREGVIERVPAIGEEAEALRLAS